jgi:hypothetical protein
MVWIVMVMALVVRVRKKFDRSANDSDGSPSISVIAPIFGG